MLLPSPFKTPGDAFRYNNEQNELTKDFVLMDVIYNDILRLYGDRAFYIAVEHFNTDQFFGESRTKVLNRAFEILIWNPDVAEDNVTHGFVKSGFSYVNEGELTYYCPMSFFVDHIEDTRIFENAETLLPSSFIMDNVVYFYNQDMTDTQLYSYIAAGDTVTLAGCSESTNNASYVVDAVEYKEIDVSTNEDVERVYIWRTELTLIPNTELIDEVETEIPIIDEEMPVEATISIEKVVEVRPKISDLIWIPKLEQLYQIEYVNDTPPHLMFNRNLSYVFNVQLYDYNTNIKVDDQVIEKIPELDNLEDLNDLILDISNDVIDAEITTHDILDTTEIQNRNTNTVPQSRFER